MALAAGCDGAAPFGPIASYLAKAINALGSDSKLTEPRGNVDAIASKAADVIDMRIMPEL